LGTDSDELEDDVNEPANGEEDYDFDGSVESLLQHKEAPSLNIYTGVEVQRKLMKHHTAAVHLMSPRKKESRKQMN
jgi:hypothetical protein